MNHQNFIHNQILFASAQHWPELIIRLLFSLKNSFLKLVDLLAQQPSHQFYAVLLSGDKNLLTIQQQLLLEVTGMQHLFSVSGMHLGMILAVCEWFLGRILGNKTAFSLVVVAWFYAFLVDFRPSVIRAATMTSISLFIRYFLKRRVVSLYLLALSVFVIFLVQNQLLTKVGFQLSVLGVVGVSTSQYFSHYKQISNLMSHNFSSSMVHSNSRSFFESVINFLLDSIFTTVFASLFIFPLILFYFGEVTLASLIANPLVLWLAPIVMGVGAVHLLVFPLIKLLIPIQVLIILTTIVDFPLQIMIKLLKIVSNVSFNFIIATEVSATSLLCYYIVLLAILIYFHKFKQIKYEVLF